jgi:CheY-like chemotaxis protein
MSQLPDAAVLIVEDEKKLRFFVSEVFRLEKIKAATAADGCEAVKYLEDIHSQGGKTPQIVLLDLTMPCMNGYEVYQHIVDAPYAAGMTVIITSAAGDKFDVLPGAAQTIQLMKPYEVATLVELLHNIAPDLFTA